MTDDTPDRPTLREALERISLWTRDPKGITRPTLRGLLQMIHNEARAALATDEPVAGPCFIDGAAEFVDFAVEYLVLTLGENHPTIKAGRGIAARLRDDVP